MRRAWLILALLPAALPAQPDLVQQARRSLTEAEQAVDKAGEPCQAGEYESCITRLTEVQSGVEAAHHSLEKTGINPSRSPRHFKDAEVRTRKILKLLRALASYIHPEDRKQYDAVVEGVSRINEKLLSGIMSRNKR